ncbi:UNVERIFIED_CONTAM: hypothetical protein Slati_2898700 [Sesamum latifolium]|uniref:Uncharacterized protein n=1 Tax=Sesamum latifolium TaxID=2727402 RepID=A0AAW2VBX8_9LAMI
MDGQTERTIQALEDMLWSCVLDFKGTWSEYLPFTEFAYSNNYHNSIGMAPYEALYGRKCRSPIYWEEVGEKQVTRPELVQVTIEKVDMVQRRLTETQDRQKSWANTERKPLEFHPREKVYLKVSSIREVMHFGVTRRLPVLYGTL